MRAICIVFIAGCGFHSPAGGADGTSPDADTGGSSTLVCPASYDVRGLPGPSRYRLIKTGHPAWEQSDACNQDMPGATHLAVIETAKELADIDAYMRPGLGAEGDSLWIGAVQPPTAISPGDGWIGFDGAPLFNGWGGSEPNDHTDNNETNHEEQFIRVTRTSPKTYFIDDGGDKSFGALCECDGKPISPAAALLVDSYKPTL